MRIVWAAALMAGVMATTAVKAQTPDGAALYKQKCAMCHGDAGQGKPNAGIKLEGTAKSADAISGVITKGGGTKFPHLKPMTTLTPAQATAVAAYVKSLK